jgi:glycosyltransferase involved in cell wall biosynthesis
MKPLHICLKVSGNANWMGGALYTKNLVRAIMSLPAEERDHMRLSLACSPLSIGLMQDIRHHVDQLYPLGYSITRSCQRLADRCNFLPPALFNPLGIDFLYPTESVVRSPYHWAAWIPDFQHKYLPEFFSPEVIQARDRDWLKVSEVAPLVVLSSQMAQNDFQRFYPQATSRSVVMNFSSYMEADDFAGDPLAAQQAYELPDRFFLVCNQFHPHKNHSLVIEALGRLKQQNICPTVAFTGNFSLPAYQERWAAMQAKITHYGIGDQIKFLGLIPRDQQIQLMRRCLAIIQPSLFEGWSTVVEDAKALGRPIILSDFPVHLEQKPAHSYFFGQTDAEQLADRIKETYLNLIPGPNPEAERVAQAQSRRDTIVNGRKFLEIVKQVVTKEETQ